jgi:hypothetical protein
VAIYFSLHSGGSRIMFKLGLDIHGVIDHMPHHLTLLSKTVIVGQGEVHVITGGDAKRAKQQLSNLDFPYTHFFSIQDYLNTKYFHEHMGINLVDGKYLYPDWLWDSAKGLYCKEQGIHLHIDDSPEYRDHFETPFVYYKRRRHGL